jgi:hypothetical protein
MAQRIVALHDIKRHLQTKRLGAQSVAEWRQWSTHQKYRPSG